MRHQTRPVMSVLSEPYFHDEAAAYQFLEGIL